MSILYTIVTSTLFAESLNGHPNRKDIQSAMFVHNVHNVGLPKIAGCFVYCSSEFYLTVSLFHFVVLLFLRVCYFPVCGVGYFGTGGTCNRCPVGFYQSATGQQTCVQCSDLYTPTVGATSSTACGQSSLFLTLLGSI